MSFPLVTICVLQVDDINGDKNVSSAQIVGKCVLESFMAAEFSFPVPLSMAMAFYHGPCPLFKYNLFNTELSISCFET